MVSFNPGVCPPSALAVGEDKGNREVTAAWQDIDQGWRGLFERPPLFQKCSFKMFLFCVSS